MGLVTLRLVSFFRRRRFDLSDQDSISINLCCISSALHPFSGIIKLADHLACAAVAMSTSGTKFTVAWSNVEENRHHVHNCSGLDFSARAFFGILEVAPPFVCASAVCSGVWHLPLSVQGSLKSLISFNLQSRAVLFGAGEFVGVRPPVFTCNSALSILA